MSATGKKQPRKKLVKSGKKAKSPYAKFSQINGKHPWMKVVPEGYILYPVRILDKGSVVYFNFPLAKEMGLIPKRHPHKMNKKLEKKILETFNLRVINEYDQEHGIKFPKKSIKENEYMATRYLQMQHENKQGKTSGDGRSIWNGCLTHQKKSWDVSSRGTGVTKLSPGAVVAETNLQSGSEEIGYGCGMAELDELYATAVMSEIFYRQGLPSEQMLAIIANNDQLGIGVRVAPNLIRPAHMFMYLKQGLLDPLKRSVDYFISRQIENGEMKKKGNLYDQLVDYTCEKFAALAARLERDYIFAWLDWDGDNILADSGIIDYGSIRQFGLRHDQYRYDDVHRFSTNLNEQKAKCKLTVQVYLQMVDFLKTGVRKPLSEYQKHKKLRDFEEIFHQRVLERLTFQMGLPQAATRFLLKKQRRHLENFYKDFSFLERMKTRHDLVKLEDGVNRPARLNMRKALILMSEGLQLNGPSVRCIIPIDLLYNEVLAVDALEEDRVLSRAVEHRFRRMIKYYEKLVTAWCQNARGKNQDLIDEINDRAVSINRSDRITGNGITIIVEKLLQGRAKGLSDPQIQCLIEAVIEDQILDPDKKFKKKNLTLLKGEKVLELFEEIKQVAFLYREEI